MVMGEYGTGRQGTKQLKSAWAFIANLLMKATSQVHESNNLRISHLAHLLDTITVSFLSY